MLFIGFFHGFYQLVYLIWSYYNFLIQLSYSVLFLFFNFQKFLFFQFQFYRFFFKHVSQVIKLFYLSCGFLVVNS